MENKLNLKVGDKFKWATARFENEGKDNIYIVTDLWGNNRTEIGGGPTFIMKCGTSASQYYKDCTKVNKKPTIII